MECRGDADRPKDAASNPPIIENGMMKVSQLPGLGAFLDHDFLKATRIEDEPWWGDATL
jgi:L-alanine-DL-glutamate epimerase-like enolase superfamily enzyme